MPQAGAKDSSGVPELTATIHEGADVKVAEILVGAHLLVDNQGPAKLFAAGFGLNAKPDIALVFGSIKSV
jgi:hypothetical protein